MVKWFLRRFRIIIVRVVVSLALFGFSLVFPVFFVSIALLISRFGWVQLAEAHAAGQKPTDGVSFYGCSGSIGRNANYTGCLDVTLSHAGVYVVPNWLFHWGHDPLQFPWSDAQILTESSPQSAGRTTLRFADENGRSLSLALPAAASSEVRTLSGRRDFLETTAR